MGSGRRCAQCERAIKIPNIENMFLFFQHKPRIALCKIGGWEGGNGVGGSYLSVDI